MPVKENPPWLFGILSMPYGGVNAITTLLIPFLLRRRGVPVNQIADVVAVALIPIAWYFLWSPIVDLGMLRRHWILLAATVSGLACAAAIAWPPASLTALTALLFAANAISMLLSSACGAVLTAIHPAVRGAASGWYQAGNLGGGALGGGATIWLAGFIGPKALAALCVALVVLPALAALWLYEEPAHGLKAGALFRALARDLWDVLKARRTWAGLAFFLSPVGANALTNLVSSIGPDYHASAGEVAAVSGVLGGLVSALGCLAGGWICDRMSRMKAYTLAGLLSAAFAAWMALGSKTPLTYFGGYAGYALGTGFAFAAFTALELEVLGKRPHAAGAAYSLLGASGNVPIVWMTSVDGLAYRHGGVKGLMAADGLANAVGAAVLLIFAGYAARRWLPEDRAVEPHGVKTGDV